MKDVRLKAIIKVLEELQIVLECVEEQGIYDLYPLDVNRFYGVLHWALDIGAITWEELKDIAGFIYSREYVRCVEYLYMIGVSYDA